jgi:hypothetical protein
MKILFNIALCIVMILTVLPSCSQPNVNIPMEINKLSLVNMWDELIKLKSIQEQNAYLHSFRVETNENGRVGSLTLQFLVNNNASEYISNLISFDESGVLHWNSKQLQGDSNLTPGQLTYNPRILFTELDEIGLNSIQSTSSGFSLEVQRENNREYSTNKVDGPILYHLKDGKLTPLKPVKLSSDHNILVLALSRTSVHVPPSPSDPDWPIEYWFLDEDLSRAESVEY